MQHLTSFPELLKALRKSMGLTQEELAQRWNYSFETISAWERGKRNPSNHEVPRLAKLLNIEPEALAQSINTNRNKTQMYSDQETEAIKREWKKAFDIWGEIQAIYRSRLEFHRDFSYSRLLENAHHVLAVGISLNDITINYSSEKIIESIIENKTVYQLCFLDPFGMKCIDREQEEGFRQGFLSELTRLNMQRIETIQNRLSRIDSAYIEQLQVSTYDLPPRLNIYIFDDTLMTVQCYAYSRGEETPLFVLNHQSHNGLFDYYASAARHILEQSTPVEYKELAERKKP